MSDRKTSPVPCFDTVFKAKDFKHLLRWRLKTRTENRQAARDKYCAKEWGVASTYMELKHENIFTAVSGAVASNDEQKAFEQSAVASPTGDLFFVRNAFVDVPKHVERKMTQLLLKTVMAHRREVDNCLSASL